MCETFGLHKEASALDPNLLKDVWRNEKYFIVIVKPNPLVFYGGLKVPELNKLHHSIIP